MTEQISLKKLSLLALPLLVASPWMPQWMLFMVTIAMANGLVGLGLMLFLRAGLVSFGQALYFCVGAYTTGLLSHFFKFNEALILLLFSGKTQIICIRTGPRWRSIRPYARNPKLSGWS